MVVVIIIMGNINIIITMIRNNMIKIIEIDYYNQQPVKDKQIVILI
jgi:hypothetical protein